MKSFPKFAFAAIAALAISPEAMAQSRAQYESMVASHARANNVPEALVHRVIVRESKYHASLVGRGGTIGLMQIKLPTARGLGYTGDAAGLRDPDTNLNWGVKYLAGAYRAANGDHNRAVSYYASGYYYAAKRQRQDKPLQVAPVLASDAAPKIVAARQKAGRRERAADRQIADSCPGRGHASRRCEASSGALLRRTGTHAAPAPRWAPALQRYALRCVRGTGATANAVQFRVRPR